MTIWFPCLLTQDKQIQVISIIENNLVISENFESTNSDHDLTDSTFSLVLILSFIHRTKIVDLPILTWTRLKQLLTPVFYQSNYVILSPLKR